MSERVRSKLLPAEIIYLDREFVQQAYDHMQLSRDEYVGVQVINRRPVGIETGAIGQAQPRLMLESPRRQIEGSSITLEAITESFVLTAIKALGHGDSKAISDQLGIPRSDTSIRGKVIRTIVKLRDKGVLMGVRGLTGHVTIRPSKNVAEASKAPPKTVVATPVSSPRTVMKMPTRTTPAKIDAASVRAVLKDGEEMLSMDISDRLGLDRRNEKGRQNRQRMLVTNVLKEMIQKNIVTIVGKRNGIMPIYKVIARGAMA
jgi:hypothetical protein